MKWLLSVLCLTTITAFSQVDKSLLEKLKTTQEQLKGKSPDNIPNPGLDRQLKGNKLLPNTNPPLSYAVPNERTPLTLVVPGRDHTGPGDIPNAVVRFRNDPRVITANEQSMLLALPQDNMPCLVPNMKSAKPMPGVNNQTIAENQNLFKLLQPKPKS